MQQEDVPTAVHHLQTEGYHVLMTSHGKGVDPLPGATADVLQHIARPFVRALCDQRTISPMLHYGMHLRSPVEKQVVPVHNFKTERWGLEFLHFLEEDYPHVLTPSADGLEFLQKTLGSTHRLLSVLLIVAFPGAKTQAIHSDVDDSFGEGQAVVLVRACEALQRNDEGTHVVPGTHLLKGCNDKPADSWKNCSVPLCVGAGGMYAYDAHAMHYGGPYSIHNRHPRTQLWFFTFAKVQCSPDVDARLLYQVSPGAQTVLEGYVDVDPDQTATPVYTSGLSLLIGGSEARGLRLLG